MENDMSIQQLMLALSKASKANDINATIAIGKQIEQAIKAEAAKQLADKQTKLDAIAPLISKAFADAIAPFKQQLADAEADGIFYNHDFGDSVEAPSVSLLKAAAKQKVRTASGDTTKLFPDISNELLLEKFGTDIAKCKQFPKATYSELFAIHNNKTSNAAIPGNFLYFEIRKPLLKLYNKS